MDHIKSLLTSGKMLISVNEASSILNKNHTDTAKDLARFAEQGKLLRIKRGFYIPVPNDLSNPNAAFDDPWIVCPSIFPNSYIAGWTACEHYGLTEQIFNSICLISSKNNLKKHILKSYTYVIKKIPKYEFFGIDIVWRKNIKIPISDIHKTIIDILLYPDIGGDITHIIACFQNYLSSKECNFNKLVEYAALSKNGALYKRLGFLAEEFLGNDNEVSNRLLPLLTQGYSKLDPRIESKALVTKWKLYVPKEMKN